MKCATCGAERDWRWCTEGECSECRRNAALANEGSAHPVAEEFEALADAWCTRWTKRAARWKAAAKRMREELRKCSALRDRIAALEDGLREIAVWSQEDQDNHETCVRQWRGCVAIARQLLRPNSPSCGKKEG